MPWRTTHQRTHGAAQQARTRVSEQRTMPERERRAAEQGSAAGRLSALFSLLTSVCTFCDPFSLEMISSAIATNTGCD